MKAFSYIRPRSLQEAAEELGKAGAKVSAGGTDLLGTLKDKIHSEYTGTVVSLKDIPELDHIKEEGGFLEIGAMAKLTDIQKDSLIQAKYPILAEAAHSVASPQLRNMATIGGNICQEPRCWYYRYPDNKYDCIRKGGALCNAVTGNSKYHSIYGAVRVCAPPCESGCPNGNHIPEYFEKIRSGDIRGAAKILVETNPLAAVTGRVCPHDCENECNRAEYDECVSIREIERFVGDHVLEHYKEILDTVGIKEEKRVAIVGSGPASLAAAFDLLRAGYGVTVYDACKEPGGMLYYGIPAYRLPRKVISDTVAMLEYLGAEFRQLTILGRDISLETLESEYDAVLLAVGAWNSIKLGCKGEESAGVFGGIDFLYNAVASSDTGIGNTVAVVGGGNTAMDACRTAKRLGADKVFILYRRTEAEMPADAEEINAAKEEGIGFKFLVSPVEIIADTNDRVCGIKLQIMEPGAPDSSGRRRPVPVEGAIEEIEADTLINAVGQVTYAEGVDVAVSDDGKTLSCDGSNKTNREKVFAAGDAALGPATVVEAMADGRKAAVAIKEFFGGRVDKTDKRLGSWLKFDKNCLNESERILPNVKPVEERTLSEEDSITATTEVVDSEARRCLNCGCAAVSPSDMAPVIIAFDGEIVTSKRTLPAEEFFTAGICTSTILECDEIVTGIRIPEQDIGSVQFYNKFRYRKSVDFPVIGVAVNFTMNEGRFAKAKIVLSAVGPVPVVLDDAADYLIGKEPTEDLACEAADIAVSSTIPLLENKYKIKIARALVRRAIASQV